MESVDRFGAAPHRVRMASVRNILAALVVVTGSAGCADDANRAQSLAHRHLIVDTHIDASYRLLRGHVDLGDAVPEREFDYPRAMRGGLDVAFMSIYTPARAADAGESPMNSSGRSRRGAALREVIASHSSLRHFVPGFHRNMATTWSREAADTRPNLPATWLGRPSSASRADPMDVASAPPQLGC